ncbi:PTS sugar transporter subunit IIA domain-containing protein [Loigolactobacillus jiayinensis]|uniref:PTS EIIA type-4 domain-containing protein n=1 Tax=Loigolactobacillus jiayinensis TaxID=2486016 RepID=A0ABW1RA74_9LACO|nr:hypothetical protein [Loigolactobacillus jiayinensis]
MEYIVAAHGKYAEEMVKSCQLITGATTNFHYFNFMPDMSLDDVIQNYTEIVSKYKLEDVCFLTDIKSGTPNNAALIYTQMVGKGIVYTGTSLSVLVFLATGETLENVFESIETFTGLSEMENTNNEGDEEDE